MAAPDGGAERRLPPGPSSERRADRPARADRELLAYMRSVGKFFGEELYERMTDELVAHYPDKTLLLAAWEHAFRNPNLVIRAGRFLDRTLKPRHQRRWSKYHVALDLKRRLDALSLTAA